ncbi:MAG TPA: glycosyltransferase family 2 protein [bacterium]|nr:glycosyltransferase family 2 protein [bacterium]HPJ72465.1 glycosyltransferase family 2 protein [bacterium]HPQ66227.1 glycosyltransferase family 2 protein [bacterium]
MTELSVCIVSWNVRELLLACLDSVRRELAGLEGEIVVVDNASGDGSADAVRLDFPEAGLIANPENVGFARACNQAWKRTRGRYVLLLNPDAELGSGSAAEMISFLDRQSRPGAGGCRQLGPDGALQPSVRAFPTLATGWEQFTVLGRLGFLRGERRRYLAQDFDYARAASIDQPMGSALFLSRRAVEEVGLFDEGYFMYFEEVDLCWRLARAGYSIHYNPLATVVHHGGASASQAGPQTRAWLLTGYLRFMRKRYGNERVDRYLSWFRPLARARLGWDLCLGTWGSRFRLGTAGASRARRARMKLAAKREFRDRFLEKVFERDRLNQP